MRTAGILVGVRPGGSSCCVPDDGMKGLYFAGAAFAADVLFLMISDCINICASGRAGQRARALLTMLARSWREVIRPA